MITREDIVLATDELLSAARSYEQAFAEETRVRHSTTEALNALNEAQKSFDTLMERIKSQSPLASDWGGQSCEAKMNYRLGDDAIKQQGGVRQ
jgi:hypothetical protein